SRAYGGRSGNTARTGDAVELQQRWRCATVRADTPAPGQRYQPCAAIRAMTTPITAVWTSSVVLAALIASAITPGAPPFSLPAAGAGSCRSGASVVLRGVQRAPYDREHLAAGTGHDATTAQFVLPVTSHIVVHLAGGAGICWSGGEALGAFPPAASWNTIHETYGMVAGVTNRADAPGITVENVTWFAYGRGVSMDAGGDNGWTIRNV